MPRSALWLPMQRARLRGATAPLLPLSCMQGQITAHMLRSACVVIVMKQQHRQGFHWLPCKGGQGSPVTLRRPSKGQ